jgi:demethylmenaquinone methyltransferase/2-methoxy-6-polyprenyl-1,4-benzoquinol methylase
MSEQRPETTHFGYRQVPAADKAGLVGQVFDSVASRYDLMNDLMSFGLHRLWKRFAVERAHLRPGEQVLDLAAGSGDLAALMAPKVGPRGRVLLSDINATMLELGRDRLTDQGIVGNVDFVIANAESLPFADASFDCLTIAFGLRNVTDQQRALAEMYRVLRPAGRCLVLEFSHPVAPGLKPLYDAYSFSVLPLLGQVVAGDAESYRYLAESIRVHPDQQTLLELMQAAGFERCDYYNLSGGVVALHRGYHL